MYLHAVLPSIILVMQTAVSRLSLPSLRRHIRIDDKTAGKCSQKLYKLLSVWIPLLDESPGAKKYLCGSWVQTVSSCEPSVGHNWVKMLLNFPSLV